MGKLIGFGGFSQAGKDASADSLAPYNFKKTQFSQPLEQALIILNPIIPVKTFGVRHYTPYATYNEKVGFEKTKKNHYVRKMLQRFGTEVGRNMFGENVWVEMTFSQVDRWLAEGLNVAVTGIRFNNELEALRDRSGTAVWVDRRGRPVNSHASDNTLCHKDFDLVLRNFGNLTDLKEDVRVKWESGWFDLKNKAV